MFFMKASNKFVIIGKTSEFCKRYKGTVKILIILQKR